MSYRKVINVLGAFLMWTSIGRSGYGDSTIGGDYDLWDGVSPNGKQYKNEATMETRNLSGADYWHLRKQNRPIESIPANLHMLNKDRANIQAYADPVETPKRKNSIPLSDRILPQKKRLNTLRDQLIELETEYKTADMSIEEYSTLRDILMVKINRAEVLYRKAVSVRPNTPEIIDESEEFGVEYATQTSFTEDSCGVAWVDELSSSNCFKSFLKNTCKAFKLAVHYKHKMSSYLQTLKDL